MRVPVTRQKYYRPRYKEILGGYDEFMTYIFVGSLRATNNFGRLYVGRTTSYDIRG